MLLAEVCANYFQSRVWAIAYVMSESTGVRLAALPPTTLQAKYYVLHLLRIR